MFKVLIVENTKFYAAALEREIRAKLGFQTYVAGSYDEADTLIGQHGSDFLVALMSLALPDAPDGEIVDLAGRRKIPAVVFTNSFREEVRSKLQSKKVIDYVVKENAASVDFVVSIVRRVARNKETRVLVVDDSRSSRYHLSEMLKVQQLTVLEAASGKEALKILDNTKNIKMVITDYNMPGMDGFELIQKIRTKHNKEDLPIIGISSSEGQALSARFIKYGANDFVHKPFLVEEFVCRISQNLDIADYVSALHDSAIRDFLTGLHNRRYFFDKGQSRFETAGKNGKSISLGMIDVDHFKKVNDTYGHDGGDAVLKKVAEFLKTRFRANDIVARFGGEEFCVLLYDRSPREARFEFEQLRILIEEMEIVFQGKILRVTVSIGGCLQLRDTLDGMVTVADERLYQAKTNGRNRVYPIAV